MALAILIYTLFGLSGLYLLLIMPYALGNISKNIPAKTFLTMFILPLIIFILSFTTWIVHYKSDQNKEVGIKTQIREIENLENALKDIDLFLKEKKDEIYNTDKIIQELRMEHEFVDSLSKIDNQTMELIMRAQKKINSDTRLSTFLMGYGSGVASTITILFLSWVIRKVIELFKF